ncbi:MAG: alpha-galactosidase [Pseudomonadota bacterium]
MTEPATAPFYRLDGTATSLVVDCRDAQPSVLYWGPRLDAHCTGAELAALSVRQEAPAREAREAPITLTPLPAAGYLGRPGLAVHRQGRDWHVFTRIAHVEQLDAHTLSIVSTCDHTLIKLVHRLTLDPDSNVLAASTELINEGALLTVDDCCAPCLPLPEQCNQIMGFNGRWSGEFRTQTVPRPQGLYLRENRSGRTSHDTFPGVIVHDAATSEQSGLAYGFHLGWSGNHRLAVNELADGRTASLFSELFYPGEQRLEHGERYTTPTLYAACSTNGLTPLSQQFHRYVRAHLTAPHMQGKAKRVHFNSWEAVYFDLSEEKLFALVDAAASVGAERFVLDDGWFRHRRGDHAGLGDWYVEDAIFPNGLTPLAEQIAKRGLEFGLWLEPEMVNPDSDLFRAHPDWVLHADPAPRVLARHQLVLDLTKQAVFDYLFERIHSLLTQYPITYIKWDMNRDLHQPGSDGGAAVHAQTRAVYALLAQVRDAHPLIEIESCSSGGGRTDYGVLAYTDRLWTSDSNDALDRLAIQRGCSFFFPAEMMGAHVGPADCHITGRRLSMALRGAVAVFGDMGIEANVLDMSEAEKKELAAAVTLHKTHRQLIFSGDLVRLDTAPHDHAFGVVAADGGEALFSYTLLESQPHSLPGRLKLTGLEDQARYHVQCVWPTDLDTTREPLSTLHGATFSGSALRQHGLQLPLMHPASPLIIHLTRR